MTDNVIRLSPRPDRVRRGPRTETVLAPIIRCLALMALRNHDAESGAG